MIRGIKIKISKFQNFGHMTDDGSRDPNFGNFFLPKGASTYFRKSHPGKMCQVMWFKRTN